MPTEEPLFSYIVLSYNYQEYIRTSIESILTQGFEDFEIVVVDDCSTDGSRDVVTSIGDARIRLLVTDRNLGGAAAYNLAVTAARGRWLVNLDADDWIKPGKAGQQLRMITDDPELDVVGTFVEFVGSDGQPIAKGSPYEQLTNQVQDLNRPEAWIGRNPLCRSSTMVRRAAHMAVGLDDPDMVRAPDYELWTRFLRHSRRFAVVPESLTCCRLQPRGVTHGDPRETLLEMTLAKVNNLLPVIEDTGRWHLLGAAVDWIIRHPEFDRLTVLERENLLTILITGEPVDGYASFRARMRLERSNHNALGRRALALMGGLDELGQYVDRNRALVAGLQRENAAYLEARDFWHQRSGELEADGAAYREARDFWHEQSQRWETEVQRLATSKQDLEGITADLPRNARGAARAGVQQLGPLERDKSLPSRLGAAACRLWRRFPPP